MWDIFFHISLDKRTLDQLIEQCNILIAASADMATWNASTYGRFIKIGTEYTLTELKRHWSLYISMQDLPAKRIAEIRTGMSEMFKTKLQNSLTLSAARSSGPVFHAAGTDRK